MKSVIFHFTALLFLLSIFYVPVGIVEGYWFIVLPFYFVNIFAWSWMIDNKWHY